MRKLFFILIIILFIIGLYARYIEPNNFKINEISIKENVPDSFKNLKIVHFSDTLINEEYSINDFENLTNTINKQNPDIIFFTGDLIDSTYKLSDKEIESVTNSLKNLEVSLYKFSIYGDNDLKNDKLYKDIMEKSNFNLLNNKTFNLFYKDNTPITITGITNLTDIQNSYLTDIDTTNSVNLTLTHYPDNFDDLLSANIVFAGHSLGGYINLPFMGQIKQRSNASLYFEKYYNINNRQLFTSNGMGTEKYHFRFLNKPSINIYKFE